MDSITDFMHINSCKFQEVVEGPRESESERASMFSVMSSRSSHQGGELLHVDKDCGGCLNSQDVLHQKLYEETEQECPLMMHDVS